MAKLPPKVVIEKLTRPWFTEMKRVLKDYMTRYDEIGFGEYMIQNSRGTRAKWKALPEEDKGNYFKVFGPPGEEFSLRAASKRVNVATSDALSPGTPRLVRDKAMNLRKDMFKDINNMPLNLVKRGTFSIRKASAEGLRRQAETKTGPLHELRERMDVAIPKERLEELKKLMAVNQERAALRKKFEKGLVKAEVYKMFDEEFAIDQARMQRELAILPDEDVANIVARAEKLLDEVVPESIPRTTTPPIAPKDLLQRGIGKKPFEIEPNPKGTADIIPFPEQ